MDDIAFAQERVVFQLAYPEEPVRSGLRRATPSGFFGHPAPGTSAVERILRLTEKTQIRAAVGSCDVTTGKIGLARGAISFRRVPKG
jgi:hypothetical protein